MDSISQEKDGIHQPLHQKRKGFIIFKTKMPSNKVITPIVGGSYYHIFNLGINRSKIFFLERNYHYFLSLLSKFISEHVSILAYCLLPNHFHLVIKVKDEIFLKKDRGINS